VEGRARAPRLFQNPLHAACFTALLAPHRNCPPMPRARFSPPLVEGPGQGAAPLSEPVARGMSEPVPRGISEPVPRGIGQLKATWEVPPIQFVATGYYSVCF
jgi:hypothetical protein